MAMRAAMEDITLNPPRAAIIQFPRKRGRPRQLRSMHDTGTPELVMKRLKQETAEALDLCLERGLLTPEQHWYGVHLRWLYTLRYGAPGVRAIDQSHFGGRETKIDDPAWRAAREAEYNEAIIKLSDRGLAMPLLELCVYNERPKFLRWHDAARITPRQADENLRAIDKIRDGLDLLTALWRR
jgi:hypothetical protein